MFTVLSIKGYRAAIALILKAKKIDVTNYPELTALIKTMAANIQPHESKLLKWNLETLLKDPYEPLVEASLKYLAHTGTCLVQTAQWAGVQHL